MQAIKTIGLDIAKSVFQAHGVDAAGNVLALSRQFIEHALRAKARHESCRGDRISPLCSRFGSEDPQRRPGDQVTLKVEVVEHG